MAPQRGCFVGFFCVCNTSLPPEQQQQHPQQQHSLDSQETGQQVLKYVGCAVIKHLPCSGGFTTILRTASLTDAAHRLLEETSAHRQVGSKLSWLTRGLHHASPVGLCGVGMTPPARTPARAVSESVTCLGGSSVHLAAL